MKTESTNLAHKRADIVAKELKRIAENHGGELLPRDVVEAARPARSPLHSYFEWDKDKAAEQWNLEQARSLIRITFEAIQVNGGHEKHRIFYSLTTDRRAGKGYRSITSIMQNPSWRQQLLDDALSELTAFRQKYGTLSELAGVFDAIEKVAAKKTKAA
jgi:hypothetical protein